MPSCDTCIKSLVAFTCMYFMSYIVCNECRYIRSMAICGRLYVACNNMTPFESQRR